MLRASHADYGSKEPNYIRKYKPNDEFTIYDIAVNTGLDSISEATLNNWSSSLYPYFGSMQYYHNLHVSASYPFRKGTNEFRLGEIMPVEEHVSMILHDGFNLIVISSQDDLRYKTRNHFSLKVTEFDLKQFLNSEDYISARKTSKQYPEVFGNPKTLCSIILRPYTKH